MNLGHAFHRFILQRGQLFRVSVRARTRMFALDNTGLYLGECVPLMAQGVFLLCLLSPRIRTFENGSPVRF